jgi:hypothetical protein
MQQKNTLLKCRVNIMNKGSKLKDILNKSPVRNQKKKLADRLNTKVAPLEEHKKVVTPQQWKFIQNLIDGDGRMTLKDSAIAAGYSENKAGEIAYKLTDPKQSPHVVAAIQRYRQDVAEKYGTTIERHMRDLQIIRDKAIEAGNYSAAVQAEYRRGQALGTIYVERKEIRHGTIDSMSAEEVRKKLEEIKLMYGGGPVIDVNPIVEEVEDQDKIDHSIYDEQEEEEDEIEEEEPEEEIEEKPHDGELIVEAMKKMSKNLPKIKGKFYG